MKRVFIISVIVLATLIVGCVPQVAEQPAGEQTPQTVESSEQQQTTGPETQQVPKPEIKAAKNATAFIDAMTEDLDCSKKSEMQELLQETKSKLADNDVRLIDAEDELKEVKTSGNAANTAVKKKVVDIVKKNEVVLKDRIAKLEALIARC